MGSAGQVGAAAAASSCPHPLAWIFFSPALALRPLQQQQQQQQARSKGSSLLNYLKLVAGCPVELVLQGIKFKLPAKGVRNHSRWATGEAWRQSSCHKREGCEVEVGLVAAMLHYTLDPHFSALLFNVCSRHERAALLPDIFSTCADPGHLEADLLAYAHGLGLQLCSIGHHYACLLSSVRAGSVIFLVGVGSLVCWKLFEHWKGDADPPAPPPSTPSSTSKRPRSGILASILEEETLVQDIDELEDEDPAYIEGMYFGPDSPCEAPGVMTIRRVALRGGIVRTGHETQFLGSSSDVTPETSERSGLQYLADASNSYTSGDEALSSSEESLPTDEESDMEQTCKNRSSLTGRMMKRKHCITDLHCQSAQRSPIYSNACPRTLKSSLTSLGSSLTSAQISSPGKHLSNRKQKGSKTSLLPETANAHPLRDTWPSSESSPVHDSCHHLHKMTRMPMRHQGDGSETPDSEGISNKHATSRHGSPSCQQLPSLILKGQTKGCDRQQPEGEEGQRRLQNFPRPPSLSDMVEWIKQRGSRGSFCKENSVASNLSDLISPCGLKPYPFLRDDSICSNLSDLASEGSEMSLDISLRDDLAGQTFTYLADIENELDDLRTNMLEMDEEFYKFRSQPDPYSFKTTFSDYSLGSSDSRPNSAFEIPNVHKERASNNGLNSSTKVQTSDSEPHEMQAANHQYLGTNQHISSSEAEGSFEWDSPQHGWSSMKTTEHMSRLIETPHEDTDTSRESVQDHIPSLEWDNEDCLADFPVISMNSVNEVDQVFHDKLPRTRLLPDHPSLELDMEEELGETNFLCDSLPNTVDMLLQNSTTTLTTSSDSAFQSTIPSHSTTTSPIPRFLPIATSRSNSHISPSTEGSDVSLITPDSDVMNCGGGEGKRFGSWDFGSKLRKSWSSEESGFMDGTETPLDTSQTHCTLQLSPVHEFREENQDPLDSSHFQSNLLNNNIIGNTTASLSTSAGRDTIDQPSNCINEITDIDTGPKCIGEKIDISSYAHNQWKGNTKKANTIRQGYSAIPLELNLHHLRQIRGDNYCAVRAALYQVLRRGLPLPSGCDTYKSLSTHLLEGAQWLKQWTFARRFSYTSDNVLVGFKDCLDTLDKLVLDIMGCENKDSVVLTALNSNPHIDIKICEAIKLHMMMAAVDLYQRNISGDSVPLFAMIMFARQSSETPKEFLANHLNAVGDTAGLEQIEMFLLGHMLQVSLEVVRPLSYGQDDFISYYPDSNVGIWPKITLIAEDDRHYNILVE
ncbi:uncharacterized protein LOC143027610 isoform X2 [Oratosquilla oratoria]|uniref:uncharacterized protein LOC143027610 isoform X2 n=1 Tax=Oratosquilla oratoria TaxID=337810 RepID=UPI003F761353